MQDPLAFAREINTAHLDRIRMTSRYFFRTAGRPQAAGSPYFADLDGKAGAVAAAIRYARDTGEDQTVFEAGSKPYPVAIREIPAAKAKALGGWTER